MAAGSKGTGTKRSTSAGTSRKRTGSGTRSTASTGRKRSSAAKSRKNTASYELQNEVVLMITLVVA
ncbi:MAG: hypothetical protein ACI4QX_08190, partial [Lachnospiraceae bacterium]